MPTRTMRSPGFRGLQLRITLLDIEPPIWRRVLVRSDTTLGRLHRVIQVVMGWTDSHLHLFRVGEEVFGVPDHLDGWEAEDERKVRVGHVLQRTGSRIEYEYDFGDSWTHRIELEAAGPAAVDDRFPLLLAGQRACPPEDVGGPGGYEEFLAALADPRHPEHESMLEWIGGPFNPEAYDVAAVSRQLQPRAPGRKARAPARRRKAD